MTTLCKKANVRYFRYHSFRHLGASALDRANVNIGSIQRILGHENRTTTEIYLHSIGEAEREAMQIFEDFENSHMDSHTARKKDLSCDRLSPLFYWWARAELNCRHSDFQSDALPTELPALCRLSFFCFC
jgi:hypothetical protein